MEATSATAAVLSNLDILERIMTFLPKPVDVRRCAGVNKTFRQCTLSDSLWKGRAALLPTVKLSGCTSGIEELLLDKFAQSVSMLLVRPSYTYSWIGCARVQPRLCL